MQCADRLMQRNNLTCQWKWVHIWLYILVTSFHIIHLMARRKPLSHLGVTNFLRVSLNLTMTTLLIENQTTSSMYRLGTANIVSPIIIFYTPGTAGCEGYLFSTAIHPRTFKFSILPGENIDLINCLCRNFFRVHDTRNLIINFVSVSQLWQFCSKKLISKPIQYL